MIKNDLKTAWRNLLKNKVSSLINVFGLAVGLTCFTVILLYVENEFNFDRFHRNPENVYRIVKDFVNEDGTAIPDATTPPALSHALRAELPEVEYITRFTSSGAGSRLFLLQTNGNTFYETNLINVDSSFFDVFDFPFVLGNKKDALRELHSMILTETTAKKYFGHENPLGKTIRMNVNNGTDYVVTGVLKDIPQNSHFTFDLLIPFESTRNPDNDWNRHTFYTYARLKGGTNPALFEANVKELFSRHQPNSTDNYYVQALTDIHLKSKLKLELAANGDIGYVNILINIAVFVILIAGINYVNLTTARSSRRAKEVGIRKVTGALRRSLIRLFLMESMLIASLALAFSMVLTALFLPLTKQFLGYGLSPLLWQSQYIKLIVPGCTLLIGFLAGLYPAFYLSSFQPLKVLKGKFLQSTGGIQLRKGLVIFQFATLSILMVGALVISQQTNFMQQKKLGFNQDDVLLLPNIRGAGDPAAMLEEMKKVPDVLSIARADGILGLNNSVNGISVADRNHISLNFLRADYDFLPTLQISLKEGRNFSDQFGSDTDAIILNETAATQLGLQKPYIGQQLAWDDENGKTHEVKLIGIVEDFHFTSFRDAIKPFGFVLEVGNGSTFFLKVHSRNLTRSLASIEKIWVEHSSGRPFTYAFQDEHTARFHLAEARFQKLFAWFTLLAILIACMGLFGLVSFTAEQRVKEISIRKVLGATIYSIVALLSADFVKLVLIAIVIASPIAWWAMNEWLADFAYHIDIEWWMFAVVGLAAVAIAVLTMSGQAIRAAVANPVDSLRNE